MAQGWVRNTLERGAGLGPPQAAGGSGRHEPYLAACLFIADRAYKN